MNYGETRILLLLEKFKNGVATPEELAELDRWYDSFDKETKLTDELNGDQINVVRGRMLARINQKLPKRDSKSGIDRKRANWRFIGIGLILFPALIFSLIKFRQSEPNNPATLDANPGKNTAHLILSDGSVIDLEKAKIGPLFQKENLLITKDSTGQISYHIDKTIFNGPKYGDNSLVVPSGGQYRVVLSDGTKVWMNAKSKFSYPSAFSGHSRPVTLSGEAYFEVAKSKTWPFVVHTPQQDIKVLGTHFNVNAYDDEKIQRTTLLEGLVQITTNDKTPKTVIIKPGQQAQQDDEMIQIRSVNSDAAAGWKDGVFVFDHTDLHELMRQLARWYNVQIIYKEHLKSRNFSGEIQRDYTLLEVLKVLELGNIHFKIEKASNAGSQKCLIIE
ncbi:FecR family protein [Mucilaginibacter sp. SG564]|uniref:FecR family protein n=1 Tax=Mucilaginibacter sp. SG564 TaxID=2587022 RepID=UPI0015516C0F|nr:FecR domain-containing protein [Mucilaginibacter sp. SG564]NOW96045.1 hypothetical protein [Mucilaginibacter sp. SG564]